MEKKITENGKSYWNGNGAYQTEYDKLYSQLVPSIGSSPTLHGELIRCCSRLFYDYCNNGNCNVIEFTTEYDESTCWSCNGDGEVDDYDDEDNLTSVTCDECCGQGYFDEEVDGEASINPFYQEMINFLYKNMKSDVVVRNLEDFLTSNDNNYKFNSNEMKVYNNLVDEVMYQVLTTENELNDDIKGTN